MFKSLLAALLLTSTAAFAQAPSGSEPYVYVPEPKFQIIPREQVVGMPRPAMEPQVIKKWCNTLRGVGAITIAIDDVLLVVVIDCPDDIKKDL